MLSNRKPVALAILMVGLVVGCSQTAQNGSTDKNQTKSAATTGQDDKSHSHDAWWCDEHGVPHDVCGLCDSKLAAAMQKKGDWCKLHDRPDSQCFACHPELEGRFAAQYEAKYGAKPPKPQS